MSLENVRVRRTRKLLRDALVDLVPAYGFDKVTVRQITERAMVSRAAFYRNYCDKYELVEQIFDEAMEPLMGRLSSGDIPALERWEGFFEHIAAYRGIYAVMLGRKGSPWFAARMRQALSQMVTGHLDPPQDSGDLVPTVLGGVFVQSVTWWLEHDLRPSAKEMAQRTGAMAAAILAEPDSA